MKTKTFNITLSEKIWKLAVILLVLGLAQKYQFEMAKLKLAKHLNVFVRHIASKCFGSFCPKKELQEQFKSYPSFDCKIQHDIIENIKQWLEGG